MRADILHTTEHGQIRVGKMVLDDAGNIKVTMLPGWETLGRNMQEPIRDGERVFDKDKDPEEWMKALPKKYDGAYLRVALKEQKY